MGCAKDDNFSRTSGRPGSEGGRYEDMSNTRAQQEWLCHKGKSNPGGRTQEKPEREGRAPPLQRWELRRRTRKTRAYRGGFGVGGSGESSPVIRRALRLQVR